MVISKRVFSRVVTDLVNSMVKDALECKSKLDRVNMINIVMAMSWKTDSAWDHEAKIRVLIDG